MPYVSEYYTSPLLTEVSMAYTNAEFVAQYLFPQVTVTKEQGKFNTYGRQVFIEDDDYRAPKSETTQAHYSVTQETYTCKEHALFDLIDDRERKESGDPRLDEGMTEFLTSKLLLKYERLIATKATTTGNYPSALTTTLSGTSQWSDYANSDPVTDIQTGIKAVASYIGRRPNTMIIGADSWAKLAAHPDLKEHFIYHQKNMPTEGDIAAYFGLDAVHVGWSIYNTVYEGDAESMSFVWGDNVIIAYVPPNPTVNIPAYGYTFATRNREVQTYRADTKQSDAIRLSWIYDYQFVCQDSNNDTIAGYLIYDTVA